MSAEELFHWNITSYESQEGLFEIRDSKHEIRNTRINI